MNIGIWAPLGPFGTLGPYLFSYLGPFGPFWDPWPFAIMSDYETLFFLGKAGSFLERQEAFWKKQEAFWKGRKLSGKSKPINLAGIIVPDFRQVLRFFDIFNDF